MPLRNVLVLAGGRGERFWPWSTAERPKQLLPLASGGRTLLAATLARALMLTEPSRVLVLTAASLVEAVKRDCAPFGVQVAGEPMMRNTAAAIGAAAAWFLGDGVDPAFAVLPADHAIEDAAAFESDMRRAFEVAERDPVLVTFGIRPREPDTNFGYIRAVIGIRTIGILRGRFEKIPPVYPAPLRACSCDGADGKREDHDALHNP